MKHIFAKLRVFVFLTSTIYKRYVQWLSV